MHIKLQWRTLESHYRTLHTVVCIWGAGWFTVLKIRITLMWGPIWDLYHILPTALSLSCTFCRQDTKCKYFFNRPPIQNQMWPHLYLISCINFNVSGWSNCGAYKWSADWYVWQPEISLETMVWSFNGNSRQ